MPGAAEKDWFTFPGGAIIFPLVFFCQAASAHISAASSMLFMEIP